MSKPALRREEQPPLTDPPSFQLFTELGIITQLATTRFERALPEGLTVSQFGVLNHFVRLGGSYSPSDLARAFQVSQGAMTNTLGKLTTKRLVRTRANPEDGRGKMVSITRRGRAVRERSIEAAIEAMRDVDAFVQEDLAQLLPRLHRLRSYLDDHR